MATTTTVASALKARFYLDQNTIPDMTQGESPALAQISKVTDWGGSDGVFPIIYGNNTSTSATLSTSQTNAGALAITAWSIKPTSNKKHYTIAKIPGDVIRMMDGGTKNAYFPAVEGEVQSAFSGAGRSLSVRLFGDGSGAIAQVKNVGAGSSAGELGNTTLICGNSTVGAMPWQAKYFEVGKKYVAASAKTGSTRNSAATLTVASKDEDAGTVTFTAALSSGIGAIAQNDYLFPEGDRTDAVTNGCIDGFEAWTPYDRTVGSNLATAFHGVTRATNPSVLAGAYADGTSKSLYQSIFDMIVKLCDRKSKPDKVWTSFSKWGELCNELGSKASVDNINIGRYGFQGLKILGPKGMVDVMPDNGCPDNRIFVHQSNTWKLLSLGKPIGFLDEDDQKMLRESAADSYEVRVGGYIEAVCLAPGWNGVIAV